MSVNMGRAQGASMFHTMAASGTSIAVSSLQPQGFTPFEGDAVMFSNGDVRQITGVSGSTVTLGEVMWSNKGDPGIGDAQLLNGDGDSIVDGATQAAVKGVLQAKNYYNLGAFDTYVSNGDGTGTVMVNTEMERFDGSENWGYNDSFNGRFHLNLKQECKAFVITQTKQFVKINQSLNLGTHEEDNSLYVASKVVYIRYDAANGNISEFKKWLSQNPLVIEYATVHSYSYKVIDAQPIRPANQEECVYWHEEWGKGLNLARSNGNVTTHGVTFTVAPNGIIANGTSTEATGGSSVYYLRIPVSELKGKTISLSGRTNDDLAIEGYWVDSNDSMHYFNGKGVVDGTPTFIPTDAKDVKVYLAVRGGTTANNVLFRPMLVASNRPYPYEPYNGDIIHENRVPLYITTESLSPAQTIGGDWESLGSFTTNTNQTLYAWRKI